MKDILALNKIQHVFIATILEYMGLGKASRANLELLRWGLRTSGATVLAPSCYCGRRVLW